jgi:hypothetical protein
MELLIKEDVKPFNDIAWDISFADSDVEMFACVPNGYFKPIDFIPDKKPFLRRDKSIKNNRKGSIIQFPPHKK